MQSVRAEGPVQIRAEATGPFDQGASVLERLIQADLEGLLGPREPIEVEMGHGGSVS